MRINWKAAGGSFSRAAILPARTSANAHAPARRVARVTMNRPPLAQASGVKEPRPEGGLVALAVAPGHDKLRTAGNE
ncbi:MAG: hypothetical protein BWX68_02055 [Verrucomicrobia bacterium ADurb.Bin063]|nr:MAG: hypothetical protein BWX68_02055 [Verrucomicrobia bacterium ADurb.Bin063]